jgi:hypothetical protein
MELDDETQILMLPIFQYRNIWSLIAAGSFTVARKLWHGTMKGVPKIPVLSPFWHIQEIFL